MEMIDLRDRDGKRTGEVKERTLVHRDGDLHGTAHVWLVRYRADRGSADVLLQKQQRDGIASETNDGISVTYTTEGSTEEQRLYRAAVLYLGSTGLLYRGVE